MTFPVFCTASTQLIGDNIIARLKNSGFHENDISFLFPSDPVAEMSHDLGMRSVFGSSVRAAGGAADAALGLLPGTDLPLYPGLASYISGGPVMASLGNITAGSIGGAVTSALVGIGVPETQAHQYAGRVKEGKILISVHAPTHQDSVRARQIFLSEHASDISTGYEASISNARAADFDYRARASSRDEPGVRDTF